MANGRVRVSGLAVLAVAAGVAALSGQGRPGGASTTSLVPYEAVVSHLAGPDAGPGYADGTAASARFAYPWGVAVDDSGVAYVADSANHTIRKIATDGQVTTIAGLSGAPGIANGPGADARFRFPTCVVAGPAGVLYVCDSGNHAIRRIAATGEVSTLAGSPGQAGFQDGTGSGALFSRPVRAAVDDAGNLVVADTDNHVIRLVTAAGVVTTLAGLPGQPGSTNGSTGVAQFDGPTGLAVSMGSAGVTFRVADSGNHAVRYVDDRHTVTTIAGAAGNPGTADGAWSAARFNQPHDIARAIDLGFVVADTGNHTVRWLKGPGTTATLAGAAGTPGFADGAGAAARFFEPRGIVKGATAYYVADTSNHAIRVVAEAGGTTTLAGNAALAGTADGNAAAARFGSPSGVAIDPLGTVFVADTANHMIRAIDPAGAVTTLAGTAGQAGSQDGTGGDARFAAPYAIAIGPQGVLYVTDRDNHTVRRIAPGGVVATLAGAAGSPGSVDGAGADARFRGPAGIAVGSNGTVYVADRDNHTIRAIAADGAVTTLAGAAGITGIEDGSGSAARFNKPTGLSVDPLTGDILVADGGNHRVRRVTPAGVVSTLSSQVGGVDTPLSFSDPVAVAVDAIGNLFVVDNGSHDIALVRTTGELRAFAGAPGTPGNVDGVGSAARFFLPRGIAAGPLGTLVIADSGSNAIRKITYEAPIEECVPTNITSRTPDRIVAGGQTATASVTAAGTPPFTFQWFAGLHGNTSSPIPDATAGTYTTPPLAATATLWARVTNACGGADSETITFTVCTYALAPATATIAHTGGAGSVTVTTESPCPWTATTSAEWITFPAGATGTGSGTLAYAVAPNAGATRTATITIGGQTHTVMQTLFPRYFVSSVAHAPGAGGTRWRTDLAVVNRGTSAVALTLTFWPYGSGDGVPVTYSLAAGATVEWKDVLVSLFQQTSTSVKGSVQIDAGAPVLISSRTYNQAATGTYGQEYPAITAGAALTAGHRAYLPQLAKSATFRTNVGVLNVGTADVTVAIKLFTAAGTQTGGTRTATVAPARYWQQDDIFTSTGAGAQNDAYATVEVQTAGGAVWAYASVIDNATGDPTTVPVQLATRPGPYLVSSQAHLPGLGGTVWRSTLSLVNGGAAEAALTLTYWPYGSGAPVVRERTLAAGAAVTWQDVLVSLFGEDEAANVKGSVAIASSQPVVVGSRTFNQAAAGTFGQGYPAITTDQALVHGQVGVIPQLKKNASTRTNIGVLNVGGADVIVEIRLFGPSGAQVGAAETATVAASRYWQQDDIFVAAGAGSQDIAYATVEVQTPGGAVWAYGSVIDSVTGDPTTMPVLVQ